MKFELHLQWKNLSLDNLVEIEDRLIERLSSRADVNGHEIGRDEADIFISTDDPQGTFEEVKTILVSDGCWEGIRVAFRETSEDEYAVLWPQTPVATATQRVPTYFPVNTFSLGAQLGGHIPREVSHEEQRMRDAFNLWQGKYTHAVGKFAFLLRVDGSMLRYTELFKIKGAQKAKLKKGWVEVEIGVPQSWWHKGDVREYKKQLIGAIEEGFRSMIEVLKKQGEEIDADALMHDWEKVKYEFLNYSSDL